MHFKSLLQGVKLWQGAILISKLFQLAASHGKCGTTVIAGEGLELPTCNRNQTSPRYKGEDSGPMRWPVNKSRM